MELVAGLGGGGGLAAGDFLGGVEVVEVVEVGDHGLEFGGVVADTAGEVEVGVVVELVGGEELGDKFLEVIGETAVEAEGTADDGVFDEGGENGAVIEVSLTGFTAGGFEGGGGLLAGFDGFFAVYIGIECLLLEGEGGLDAGEIVAVLGEEGEEVGGLGESFEDVFGKCDVVFNFLILAVAFFRCWGDGCLFVHDMDLLMACYVL